MKNLKKIWLAFIIVFSTLFLTSHVSALENTGTLQFQNRTFNRTFTFSSGGILGGKHSHFYHATITTANNVRYYALCFGLQQAANTGDVYYDTGVKIETQTTLINAANIRQSYQYYMDHPNDKDIFIISQIAIWMFQNSSSSINLEDMWDEFLGYITQAYAAYGYKITDTSVLKKIEDNINTLISYPTYMGNLTIWRSKTKPNGQPFIAPGEPEAVYACPDNSRQAEVTTCMQNAVAANPNVNLINQLEVCRQQICTAKVACKNGRMVNNGDVDDCEDDNETSTASFSYTATTGTDENVHSVFGEVEKVAGLSNYCKLYCSETGEIILPGGFGNALIAGTNIVWPTSSRTYNSMQGNVYPLKFSGIKTCRLAIQDPDAPGTDCVLTPYEDYIGTPTSNYGIVKSMANYRAGLGNDNKTWEQVRITGGDYYVGDTTKSGHQSVEEYCGKTNSSSGLGDSVNLGVATYYVANNSGYYTKYSSYTEGLRANLKSLAESYQSCHNSDSCHYNYCCLSSHKECSTNKVTGKESCTTVCDKYGHASKCGTTSDYNNRQHSYNNAYSNYVNLTNATINNCQTYIKNFNATRNIQNEISKCFNYETKGCMGGSSTCSIYDFTANATVDFEDSEYSLTESATQVNRVKYTCTNCNVSNKMKNYDKIKTFTDLDTEAQMKNDINTIKSRVITVKTNNVSFELDSPYEYVNKRTGKAATSPSEYTYSLGYEFLPISYENEVGRKYDISLIGISFGDTSGGSPRFDASDYTCHYDVKGTGSNDDECLCPVGTMHEGQDLFNIIKNTSSGITCADAQLTYCDNGNTTDDDFDDDDKQDKFCPNDMSKKITACLYNGYSYDYCTNLICYGGGTNGNNSNLDGSYHCKNTNGVSGKMDITSCVYTKVLQGLSVSEAIDECDQLICPIAGGIKIIYRTISLENPFPSYNADTSVSQSGLTIGMFNDDVKGRYPGSNWNSQTIVHNEILYNRGVKGSELYKKEPLYKFVLTTDTIKAIRNYNDTRDAAGGYADFTLDCKNNNSTACVSTFVHNRAYGLVSGVCQSATSKNNFYVCNEL